jgi:chromosomal replication initiation ATPase DnaA
MKTQTKDSRYKIMIVDITVLPYAALRKIEEILQSAGIEPIYREKTQIDFLIDAIESVFRVNFDELISESKKNNLPYARRVFFYFVKKMHPRKSDGEIAGLINKDRTLVKHSLHTFNVEYNDKINPKFKAYVDQVKEKLAGFDFIEKQPAGSEEMPTSSQFAEMGFFCIFLYHIIIK